MDSTQEEMKSLKLLDNIVTKSFKTVFAWKKIFTQITLTLILPLVIIFLTHMEISHRFFYKIEKGTVEMVSNAYNYYLSQTTSTDRLIYLLFNTISITIVTLFSLLSIAAVVLTIASIFTDRDITYSKVMKVVPKVWKRLTITFLWMLLTFVAYNLIFFVVFFVWFLIGEGCFISTVVLFYVGGLTYLGNVWQLANVVSVLENSYGLKAMMKAMDLMKGESVPLAVAYSFPLYALLLLVVLMYRLLVLFDHAALAPVWKVAAGIVCCIVFVITLLLLMVTQTVMYLVCTSQQGEGIDKESISTYLGAYLGDSQPALVGEDIQLGRPQNQPVSQVK